jgi:transposase InsO family protein
MYQKEIELAEILGYTIEPQRMVGDPPIFSRSRLPHPRIRIWACVNNRSIHWACAEMDNGSWVNHRYYSSLTDALTTEAK